MAPQCKKSSICEAGPLILPNLPRAHLQNDNEQPPLGGTMSREGTCGPAKKAAQAEVDVREIYFLIMHFLSDGPCRKTCDQLRKELSEYKLLPRRYHAWYSRAGTGNGDDEDDGVSVPLSYSQLLERYPFIEKNHLVKLLEQLFNRGPQCGLSFDAKHPTAADASTLLGSGSVSLLNTDQQGTLQYVSCCNRIDQILGLTLRELGGGLARHHRAPSIRAASYAIVKPSVLVNRIQIIKTFRGHRNAVYCAIFDKSGEYIITGSDDRLVKIWSTATGFCLRSCRGHEGDITDLAVSANNTLVASASNDCFIRVWRFPDGLPISVLKGHTSAVTAIAFSPRQGCEHHLLSASDDGSCRIWDARDSSVNARIYAPKVEGHETGSKAPAVGPPNTQSGFQILCCAFNAGGTIFVTGSADKLARVWDACKWTDEIHGGPNHELDSLKGHEDDVNYVQFSGCAAPSRPVNVDAPTKDERISKFRNSWFAYESIVTCSRDGSAIIWTPRPRKYHGKSGRWTKAYHLRVPPPPMPPQPPRGVPRQRLLPTPRGVNMIVWSLDNRYVLAAIMDCRICVWNAVDGSLVHSLTGHTKSTFVLDVHPYDPRIAMSAGYDGRVIIWDIWEGRSIHVYETGEFNLVDGKFSPDGTSIVISDEVGQIYLLATGEGKSQKDAKYDQFFLGDYRPLTRDVHGNVLDQETQLPPQQRNLQDLLCDANMIPYAEPYQSMYQQRRLGALGINWQPPLIPWVIGTMDDGPYLANGLPGLPVPLDEDESLLAANQGRTRWVEQPIDEDPMDWEQETGDDTGSDYTLSYENASDEDEREGSVTGTEDFLDSLEDEDSSEDNEQSQRARLRRSERNKRKAEGIMITSSGRLVKRKYKDGGEEFSVRRSKQRKKVKRKGSFLGRASDQEQSRRPKRLAARNARLIFSQISAEEDEQMSPWQNSHSDSSENVYIPGEEIRSTGQSLEKDCDNVEKIEETSTVEPEPSEIGSSSRRTQSNVSVKLYDPSKEAVEEDERDSPNTELCLDQATKGNLLPIGVDGEGLACTSSPKYKNADHLISQSEYMDTIGVDGSTSGKVEDSGGLHENLDTGEEFLEADVGYSRGCKRGWEGRRSMVAKRARVGESSHEALELNPDEPSKSQSGNIQILNGNSEASPACRLASTVGLKLDECSLQQVESLDERDKIEDMVETNEIFQSHMADGDGINLVLKSLGLNEAEQAFETSKEGKLIPKRKWEDIASVCGVGARKPPNQTRAVDDFTHSLHPVLENLRSHGGDLREEETTEEVDQHGPRSNLFDTCSDEHMEQGAKVEDQEPLSSLEHSCGAFNDDPSVVRPIMDEEIRSGKNENLTFLTHDDNMQEEGHFRKEVPNCVTGTFENKNNDFTEGETDVLESSRSNAVEREDFSQEEETALQGTGPFVGNVLKAEILSDSREGGMVEGQSLPNVVRNPSTSTTVVGGTTQVTSAPPTRRQQLMGTSWQHNSPICLWLRQGISEATASELSASEDDRSSDTGGIGCVKHNYATYEAGIPVPIRRGRRKTAKHLERENIERKPLSHGPKKQGRSAPPAVKVGTGIRNVGLDVDARMSRMSVRSKGKSQEDKCANSEHINRLNVGNNDCDTNTIQPRFSMRPRRTLGWKEAALNDDGGKPFENFAVWRGKRRSRKKVSWLMLTKVEEGTRYIPQFGDEVAYVLQGQDQFPGLGDLEDKGPSKSLRTRLRAVEMCRVVGLEYGSLPRFSGISCKLTLKLIDEECRACGKTFKLSLPELTDFPDFIIEKSRYEAGMRRNWTKRDKCRVWWREDTVDDNGNEKTGEWYQGRVVSVGSEESSEFPGSPWEQCSVNYKGDSTGPHRHSPWELFDVGATEIASSHLDELDKLRVLSCIEEVEESCKIGQDEYGLRGLRKLFLKPDFLSKTPVPLSVETIKARLNNNYYRSLDALRHDIQLLVTNAEKFLFDNELTLKIRRFASKLLGDE